MPESGGGAEKPDQDAADAEAYLRKYGHGRLTRFPDHLPYALAAGIILFEIAGGIMFFFTERKEMRFRSRIEDLTEYLKAAGRGEAACT